MADFSNDLNLALRIRALVEGQGAVVDLGNSFIDLNQRIENLIRGLTAISGSTEGAQREFEYLADVAQKYGLKILELSDNYVKLIAASKGTALEGEAVKKVFESVSGAMSDLGGDTVTTHRAFTALAQMMSKGQIYSEELKGQLAEAIPGALGIMSRALGITTDDLRNLMEAGSLSAEVLLPFATQLSKEYGNLSTSGRTFTQSVNDLKNTWTLLMERLENGSGAFSAISASIEYLSKSSGVLAGAVGVGLAVAFGKLTASIAGTVASVKNFIPLIGVQANATQRAAAANLEAAIATEATASANARAALSSENLLRAQLAVATNAQVRQRIEAALQVAVAQRIISDKQAAAAALQLSAAQGALVSSTTVFSRVLNFLAGPGGLILTAIAAFGAMAFAFREQDEATKNLSKSTEEYAKSLEGMSERAIVASIKRAEADRETTLKEIENAKNLVDIRRNALDADEKWGASSEIIAKAQSKLSDAVDDLDQSEKRLIDTDIKLRDSRTALVGRSSSLIVEQERLRVSNDDLSASIKAQEIEMKNLYAQKRAGKDVDYQLQVSQKKLSDMHKEEFVLMSKIRENLEAQKIAMSDYVSRQKALAPAIDGTSASLKDQGLTTEQLEAKFRALVQAQVLSVDRQNILKRSIIELNGEQEALGISIKSQVDLLTRQAAALGDVTAARAANIAKAEAERQSAQQSLIIARLELQAMEEERREKVILLETNPKLAKQTGEQIAKLDALIVKQRSEVQARKDNVVATREEVEAAKVAGETISASQKRQASEAIALQEQLGRLRDQYADMVASGEQMRVIETVMEAIRLKEKEIADQAHDTAIATAAAFKSLGLNAEEVLTGMDFETRKAIDALKTLGVQGKLTGVDLRKAMDKAVDLADSETEIKAVISALNAMKLAGVLSSADVNVAIGALELKLSGLKTSVDPVTRAMENLGIGVPEKLAAVAESARVSFEEIRKGGQNIENVRAAFLEWAKASLDASESAGRLPDPMLKTVAASLGLTNALESLIKSMKRGNPELDKMAERYQNLSRIASDRVSSIEETGRAQLDALQIEADYYRSIGATSVAMQKEQEISRQRIEIAKAVTQAKIAELEAQLAEQGVAAARLEDGKATNALYAQERQAIERKVAAINAEIEAQKKLLDLQGQNSNNLSANSDIIKKLSNETDRNTESVNKNSEAQQENVKHTNDGKAALQGITEYLGKAREAMDGLSEKTRQLFEVELARGLAQRGVAGASAELLSATIAYGNATTETEKRVGSFSKELANANELIKQSAERSLTAMNGFAIWEVAIDRAAGIAKKAFYEQAIAAAQLQQQVEDFAATGIRDLDQATIALSGFAQAAKNDFANLDEQDLSNLNKSIDEATSKLERMKGEATDAKDRLAELNAEIASANGDTDTADKLKLQLEKQQAIAEVERNLAEARNAQNTDLIRLYEAQLSKLDELYRIKEKNLEADIKAQKLAEQQKNAKDTTRDDKPTSQTVTSGTAPASGPTTINNTFLIDPTKLANEEWVKKNVMPTIEKVGRLRA